MKTCNYPNIFFAAALALALNACTRYPAYENADVFFLDKTSLNMYLGDTVRVVASPGKATYSWSCDNEEVVTVDQTGLVKAVNYGFATVTVKSGDAASSIDVNVARFIPLTGISPSTDTVQMSPDNTFQLWAYPVPANASEYSFTWRSEDNSVATVNRGGMITAVAAGTTNIVVSYGGFETRILVEVVSWRSVLKDAVGIWLFDDPDNPLKATRGQDLTAIGFTFSYETGTVYHDPVWSPIEGLKAVSVAKGTYFKAVLDMEGDNEDKNRANRYTLMFDFRIRETGLYYSFFQTAAMVFGDDAECMINSSNHIGVGIPGYSQAIVTDYEWYRLVVAVDLYANSYDLYLDGTKIFTGSQTPYADSSIVPNGRFALNLPILALFCDNTGDDNEIDASGVAVWNRRLTDGEISILGHTTTYYE